MSGTMVETGAASASGSIVAYILLKLWTRTRDRSSLKGLLLLKGKTYLEENFSNPNTIFFDMDKFICDKSSVYELPLHAVRLNLFPKAARKLKSLKNDFKNKTLIICSSCFELLDYLDIKKRKIKVILPSSSMMKEEIAVLCEDKNELYQSIELIRNGLISSQDKKEIYCCDNWDQQTSLIKELYKLNKINS
jgi:hypothetical protein